jgi:hypothetical protein
MAQSEHPDARAQSEHPEVKYMKGNISNAI